MDEGTASIQTNEIRGSMKTKWKRRGRKTQMGIALLIAIFVLMLVSVVAMALMLSSSTETALGSNFRSSSSAYYAALAGLEEGRGRLLSKNPGNFNTTDPGFMPAPGTTLAVGQPRYILNPAPGENVVPWDLGTPATYPDTEYQVEFGAAPPNPSPTANSVSTVAGIPGPLYKWVRINAVTEQSLNIDVDGVGGKDGVTPLFYDPMHLDGGGNVKPSLIVTATPPASARQALEITALSSLPDGSQKLLQYIVAPALLNLTFVNPPLAAPAFSAALTLVGSNGNDVVFATPGTPDFFVKGSDQFSVGGCAPGATPVLAVGYANGSNDDNITKAPAANYPGSTAAPSIGAISLPSSVQTSTGLANLRTPSGLETLVQDITLNADKVITPSPPLPAGSPLRTYTQADLPTGTMSATNPMTIVVDGNLNLDLWHGVGYGLLVVRGELDYDPDASWNGIVLVIGQGKFVSTKSGTGQFNGAMVIAQTRDTNGNLLASLKPALFSETGGSPSGYGIYYSSCWIKAAMPATSYKVLSFREIPQ
jgi:hypothetical protein